jgi:hypothetical protein
MDLISTGMIKQQTADGPVDRMYEMKYLDMADIDEVLELQQMVYDSLDDKQKFVTDPRTFFEETALVAGKGMMIGVFVEGRMIAARSISFPGLSQENLGLELHFEEEDLKKVCHLEASMVLPEFRGNHLQAVMLKPTLAYIQQEGYCIVLATISPYNYPSLKNVMDAGLVIRDLKARGENYGGKLRFLLALNLCRAVPPEFGDQLTVQNTDITLQKTLLSRGYAGFTVRKLPDQKPFFTIHYGLPYPPLMGKPSVKELLSNN